MSTCVGAMQSAQQSDSITWFEMSGCMNVSKYSLQQAMASAPGHEVHAHITHVRMTGERTETPGCMTLADFL